MTPPSAPGVLVFDAGASIQHVDAVAASVLDIDPDSAQGTAADLFDGPISTADGETYSSLDAHLRTLLDGNAAPSPVTLPDGHEAEVRLTGRDGAPTGVVLLIQNASSPSEENDRSARRRDRRLRDAQNRLLKRLASGAPLSEILTDLVSFIEAEWPGMLGSVLLLDEESQTLHHGAAPSLPDAYVEAIDGLEVGPQAGSCGSAAYHDERIVTEDIRHDERWAAFRSAALEHDLRACWSTPIRGEDDTVLGTFALYYDEPRSPDAVDYSLIEQASHLASVAIEHDRQKRELQLQKDQLRRLVENAQPIVFFLDADGTFLLSEGEDLAAVGLEPGEVVGESVHELYADHPTLLRYIDRALDGETVDATLEIEDVVFDIWYAPYYDRGGAVAGCIGMAVDITERREAEAALRANRDLLRRTQEMAHVGGWEYDPETDTMIGTEETYRIYEVPVEDTLTLEESVTFYPPSMASSMLEAARRCLEEGEPFDLEGPMTAREGTERWVRIRGEPRRREDGTVAKMVGTVQDLTERHEMEQELREQKEWLQSITDNISGGIYRSTDDGLVYANRAFLDLFGYASVEEMADADVEDLYATPEVRDDLIRRENETGGLDGVEVEYRRKDGSTFVGLLRSTQIRGDDGEPRYYDGVITDITEQKARERQYRTQREKIEALYGPSGQLLEADSREDVASCLIDLVHNTFGYPGVAVRYAEDGRLVPVQLSPEVPDRMPERPAFRIEGDSAVADTFRAGETRAVDDARTLDDSFDYGEARAVAGVPLGTHGILTIASFEVGGIDDFDLRLIDILARKATAVLGRIEREQQLRSSEARFRGLFEEAALGIALLDPDGVIVKANPELASMFGYDEDTLHGRPFSDLIHPDDRDDDRARFEELVSGTRERYEAERRYVRRDDTTFWGRGTMSQHKGPGRADVIGMIEDVSDRKAYEEQLREAKQEAEEASRLKSALLANMSHEIRTPLTSIIGFMGLLKDNLSGSEARYATLAHRGGKRLMETLDSVLQLSKLEAGVTEPIVEEMDLVQSVQQTLDLYASQAAENDIDLRFDASVDALRGRWAPSAIQRILSNLLSNALKFTPAGGTVAVRLRASEAAAVLEVEDTGIGISEEFRPRLFKAFTQESQGLQREHEGSGLGLAIVNRLVDLLDGRIDVESTKGAGTHFRVFFPIEADDAE